MLLGIVTPVGPGHSGQGEVPRAAAASNAWSATGNLNVACYDHTTTLLTDGRVLVTGGMECCLPIADAEVYDPAMDRWTLAEPLPGPRAHHTATLTATPRDTIKETTGDAMDDASDPDGSFPSTRKGKSAPGQRPAPAQFPALIPAAPIEDFPASPVWDVYSE